MIRDCYVVLGKKRSSICFTITLYAHLVLTILNVDQKWTSFGANLTSYTTTTVELRAWAKRKYVFNAKSYFRRNCVFSVAEFW